MSRLTFMMGNWLKSGGRMLMKRDGNFFVLQAYDLVSMQRRTTAEWKEKRSFSGTSASLSDERDIALNFIVYEKEMNVNGNGEDTQGHLERARMNQCTCREKIF